MKPLNDCRVLVTGGAGFIGSALVWALNRRGCDRIVIADVRGQTEKKQNLAPLRFSEYLEADDLLPRLQNGALGQFDLILHLGACSSTLEQDVAYLRRNNFEYTRDLAAWSLAQNVRFVYASSAATYGDGSAGMSDTEENLERFHPLNAYGDSKHQFDLHAQRTGWLPHIVGLKYFNVYGPNESHKSEMRSVVNKSYAHAADTGLIRLFQSYRPDFADGEQQRDFLYIKDAVAMTLHLATTETAGGLFNIGSGEAHSWNELARAIFAALGRSPRIEYVEMPLALRGKYQYFTQANIAKLRATGYTAPITPLSEAVRDYVQNYLAPNRYLGEESRP